MLAEGPGLGDLAAGEGGPALMITEESRDAQVSLMHPCKLRPPPFPDHFETRPLPLTVPFRCFVGGGEFL